MAARRAARRSRRSPRQLANNPTDGGAASVKVPAGQALYVHYDKGNGGVGGIRVTVTQSS